MLKGNSVRLRALEPADLDQIYQWENDTAIWKVSGTFAPFPKYTLEEYIRNAAHDIYTNRQLRLAIDLLAEPVKTIGLIDLFEFDPLHRKAGVGILIGDQSERRKNHARESLLLLADYAFEVLNLHQLYCYIPETNHPSLRLFASSGFKEAGILKEWIFHEGTWENVIILQRIHEEFIEE